MIRNISVAYHIFYKPFFKTLLLVFLLLMGNARRGFGCELNDFTEGNAERYIEPWVRNVQNGWYSNVYAQLRACYAETSKYVLVETIKEIYNADNSIIRSLIQFVEGIPDSKSKFYAYESLVEEVMGNCRFHSQDMMYLIYKIKKEHDTSKWRSNYQALKSKLPKDMRSIVFGECVYIHFSSIGELMYEAGEKLEGSNRVKTWRKGYDDDKDAEWYFEPQEENGKLFFYIKANYVSKGKFLGLNDWSNDYYGDSVVTHRNGNYGTYVKWLVEVVPDGYFRIKNWNGLYLYSPRDWCRNTEWNCFWRNDNRGRRVYADNVSKYRNMKIYANGKTCSK